MRILIAEDDQKLLKSLLHIYKINNYLADGVTNGTDALQYALTGNYDGLVLDIMMPGMDGIEVLKHLRSCGFPLRHCFSRQKPRFTSGLKVWTPERMSALIRKLISLARMDESDAGLETEVFNLSDAVTDSIAAFRPLPESRHLTLLSCVSPMVRLRGDEAAIRQLLSILLDNAVKYCDAGGTIRVTLKTTGLFKGIFTFKKNHICLKRQRVLLTVDNTYATVGGLKLDLLFDRFYRSDRARTIGEGFGVGLSTAKSIVEKHHGKITAQAPDNSTIRFQIKL